LTEEPDQSLQPALSATFVVIFYGIFVGLAWLLGVVWLDLDLLTWHDHWTTPQWVDVCLGVGLGLLTVAGSHVLERTTQWARELSAEFRKILGNLSPGQVLIFALASGIGEEIFFRGFLQQALSDRAFGGEISGWVLGLVVSSVLFGLLHIGPDRSKFLPWTIMALVLGFAFGALYLFTGNILGPVIAHFVINFLNLLRITAGPAPDTQGLDDDGS
jgi:uncharacterized protein